MSEEHPEVPVEEAQQTSSIENPVVVESDAGVGAAEPVAQPTGGDRTPTKDEQGENSKDNNAAGNTPPPSAATPSGGVEVTWADHNEDEGTHMESHENRMKTPDPDYFSSGSEAPSPDRNRDTAPLPSDGEEIVTTIPTSVSTSGNGGGTTRKKVKNSRSAATVTVNPTPTHAIPQPPRTVSSSSEPVSLPTTSGKTTGSSSTSVPSLEPKRQNVVFPSPLRPSGIGASMMDAASSTTSSMKPSPPGFVANPAGLSSQIPPPPRFRLLHPHGFRMLKKSSVIERSMRNYFRLPEAPSDVIRNERKRVQKQLIELEKDELEEKQRISGSKRSGVALDGFLLLNAAGTTAPEEVEIVTLQTSKLVRSVPEDLSYFQNLFFIDVSENELLLEDLLMLGGAETIHMAYNKIPSLRGIDDVMQWQLDHQKSIITEFRPTYDSEDDTEDEEIEYDVLLPQLHALNLSYNRIPANDLVLLSYFPSLRQLDLSGNNLRVLPMEISGLTSVTHLALEKNSFSSNSRYGPDVFVALSTMPSLVEVNLNYNKLTAVPPLAPEPGKCFFPSLEVIGLAHNNFKTTESLIELANLHHTLRRVALADNPLSKDPTGSQNAQLAFDKAVVTTFVDMFTASSSGSGQFGAKARATAEPNDEETWKNESWCRLIPVRDESGEDGAKLDVKTAAAAAAAAAAAERREQEEKHKDGQRSTNDSNSPKDPSSPSPLEEEGATAGSTDDNGFYSAGEEYIRCDDINFDDEDEEEDKQRETERMVPPHQQPRDGDGRPSDKNACDSYEREEEEDPSSGGAGGTPQRVFASAEEYLDQYFIELIFEEAQMPKRSTRHFLSAAAGGLRAQLVTIPEYQEFMDIYRLAGGKRAKFKREEQRKKQKGVKPSTPVIVTKSSVSQDESPKRSDVSCSSPPLDAGWTPHTGELGDGVPRPDSGRSPQQHSNTYIADEVFLTAVNEEEGYPLGGKPTSASSLRTNPFENKNSNNNSRSSNTASPPFVEQGSMGVSGGSKGSSSGTGTASRGRPPIREVLPSVCPVTTNVHGAMTELRALLRKPLPSLPYATAHLTAPSKSKIPRKR